MKFLILLLCSAFGLSGQPAEKATVTSSAAASAPTSSSHLPKELKLSWGNLTTNGQTASVSVAWNGQVLEYQLTRHPWLKPQASDRFTITPRRDVWESFWKDMDEVEVWQWSPSYGSLLKADPHTALERRAWDFALAWGTNRVHSVGTNCYPCMTNVLERSASDVMFNRFWHATDRLLGRPIEVAGSYFAAFEASVLTPSTGAYADQRWWLWSNPDFNDRYEKLRSQRKDGSEFGGPTVNVRLRGRLVGPGRYGHLNSYDYEFYTDEVLEMTPAPR